MAVFGFVLVFWFFRELLGRRVFLVWGFGMVVGEVFCRYGRLGCKSKRFIELSIDVGIVFYFRFLLTGGFLGVWFFF